MRLFGRVIFFWESIASLPMSKRLDLLFFGAFAIASAIVAEGFTRYMAHYLSSSFQTVAYILFVSCVE